MASILKVDALQGIASAGAITVTSEGGSATFQLQQGVAKAWVHHDASAVAQDSFNRSSGTDVGVGLFQTAFLNAMSNASFSVGGMASISGSYTAMCVDTNNTGFSTSFISVAITRTDSGGTVDPPDITNQVCGDLA
jgi:hypothetical protein